MVVVQDCRALKKSMYTIYLIDVHNIMNKIRLEWMGSCSQSLSAAVLVEH